MSTNHHTAIATTSAANAATFNSPLGQLDAAITNVGTTANPFNDAAFDVATTLTIATGAITVTQAFHIIAAETGTTDTLDTINAVNDSLLFLKADSGDTITIDLSSGNINGQDTANFTITGDVILALACNNSQYSVIGLYGAVATPNVQNGIVDGRLTLSSSDPSPVADQTAATTLYYLPYLGNQIALYDGADWALHTIPDAGISIAIPATTDTNYDVFVYDVSGTKTLELNGWTNDTTRATALTRQNGVYVLTGLPTRRYVGTIRTTGVSGQCEDSLANRLVWNYYNRKRRTMQVIEGTNSWSYTSATLRPLNNSTTNRLSFVSGVEEEPVNAVAQAGARTTSGADFRVGIGLDSTTAISALTTGGVGGISGTGVEFPAVATFRGTPGLGYHYLQVLESGSTGVTFVGDDGGTAYQAGIHGEING